MKQPNGDEHEIQPGEIRFSDIIAWVLDPANRDTYPLPDNLAWDSVYYDIPESVAAGHRDWINVSKKQFAEAEGVCQSQVSRWITAGLPVREDGRLDMGRAVFWLEGYRNKNKKRQMLGWKL